MPYPTTHLTNKKSNDTQQTFSRNNSDMVIAAKGFKGHEKRFKPPFTDLVVFNGTYERNSCYGCVPD